MKHELAIMCLLVKASVTWGRFLKPPTYLAPRKSPRKSKHLLCSVLLVVSHSAVWDHKLLQKMWALKHRRLLSFQHMWHYEFYQLSAFLSGFAQTLNRELEEVNSWSDLDVFISLKPCNYYYFYLLFYSDNSQLKYGAFKCPVLLLLLIVVARCLAQIHGFSCHVA